MRIIWDQDKAESNWRKHQLRFERAAEVFRDQLHETVDDPFSIGETRLITTGVVRGVGVVVVVHTSENESTPDELIRIISARRAERHERRRYEDG